MGYKSEDLGFRIRSLGCRARVSGPAGHRVTSSATCCAACYWGSAAVLRCLAGQGPASSPHSLVEDAGPASKTQTGLEKTDRGAENARPAQTSTVCRENSAGPVVRATGPSL